MKRVAPIRGHRSPDGGVRLAVRSTFFFGASFCGLALAVPAVSALAQAPTAGTLSATQTLLDRARGLEARGRMDMASQVWQQVLLADSNNSAALAGLARAAKLAGNGADANRYIDRLSAIDPKDPNIARIQTMMSRQSQTVLLAQAGKLAEAGQYQQAMVIYREVFGPQPPPGEWALAYYETEAATDDGRGHAIAGLRALTDQYPTDSRYQIALGRILSYSPRTRAEGRKLLERHSSDPKAVETLRQSLGWDSQNPAAANRRAYPAKHSNTPRGTALKKQPKRASKDRAEAGKNPMAAGIAAAYAALNGRRIEEAEERFKEILAVEPESGKALAGMGYVRMQQSNFGGAISYLEQAEQDGAKDVGVENALKASRFYYVMGEGAIALNGNDLPTAEKQYQAALTMRPGDQDAFEGLGETLMKADQPQAAVEVYEQYVKVKSSAPAAWRGLFAAEYGAGDASGALLTERQIPIAVRTQLMSDPEFLRTLASAYTAVGREIEAQRVLRGALDLPFPADARGIKSETQLQYAGLLQMANRLDQAAGLFRQVLEVDPENTNAWEGLIRVEHAMKQDGLARQTLESMPLSSYDTAMRVPGFESTAASVYQAENKLDVAQSILEKAVAQQSAAGQTPSVGLEIQLAGVYLAQNNVPKAFPLYRQILSGNPTLTDAWKGLLSALHASGHDREALAQVRQIPPDVRQALENDVDYLETMGSVYSSLGEQGLSMFYLMRVKQHYEMLNLNAPADIDIQNAYLLFNSSNDRGLYRQLMMLGGRQDLTVEQRRTIQTIWSLWAVRRANQEVAAGNTKRALKILNAAARAFPDNSAVQKALASGYARAGQPKQAVAIFMSQDMTSASVADYKAAIGAALAAKDKKSAETWLRFGLNQYPKDAQMLLLGAKYEQARGDSRRAAEYYRASLAAMPPADPGAELADELSRPAPLPNRLPSATQPPDLATLLEPGAADVSPDIAPAAETPKPYLPAYGNAYGSAPVQLYGNDGMAPSPSFGNAVPSYMANPALLPQTRKGPTLKDYVAPPIEQPEGGYAIPQYPPYTGETRSKAQLPPSPQGSLTEQEYQQEQIRILTQQAQGQSLYPNADSNARFPTSTPAANPSSDAASASGYSQPPQDEPPEQKQIIYGPYVPYVPPTGSTLRPPADLTTPSQNTRHQVPKLPQVQQQYPQPAVPPATRNHPAANVQQSPSTADQPGALHPGFP